MIFDGVVVVLYGVVDGIFDFIFGIFLNAEFASMLARTRRTPSRNAHARVRRRHRVERGVARRPNRAKSVQKSYE